VPPTLGRLEAAGRAAVVAPLAPSSSTTTLRRSGGALALADGPFVRGVGAQLVGCWVVHFEAIDEALAAASEVLGVHTAVEIRPVLPRP
jgi:hypothetical protein